MKKNQKKKKSIIRSIMLVCLAAVCITAVAIGGNAVVSMQSMLKLANSTYETAVDDGYNAEIKSQVQCTIAVLQSEYDKFKAGEKTEEEAKNDAKETIRAMRYRDDQSGYFWIDDKDYTLVMHPILVENEGQNRYELEDKNGVMIIQEIMKVCDSAEKGGYNEFYFTKSDGVTVAPKVAYSEMFEPWGWAVSTGNYIDDMDAQKKDVFGQLNGLYDSVLIRVDIVFVAAIAAAMAVAFLLGKRIISPLNRIQKFADGLSEGDLTGMVEVKTKNEIGQTADSLMQARKNMSELICQIQDVAGGIHDVLLDFQDSFRNVKESSSQVSEAVESIVENITRQAASTDDANHDVSDMAGSIKNTSAEIGNLDKNAGDMLAISRQTDTTFGELISVNNRTRKSISIMAEQTKNTNVSVQKIQGAAQFINEISEQTSLLALNASIEAARAGEAGKGFAVVAGEIAKLANQSAASVEEISQVLIELQNNAAKSVDAMSEINQSVEEQVNSLTGTQTSFQELCGELSLCMNSVKSIDTMSADIDRQRVNVVKALDVLNNIAQDNAAMAEETSAMSAEVSKVMDDSANIIEELEQKVQTLLTDIGRFKV